MSLWTRPNGPQSIAASASNQSGLNVQAGQAATLPGILSLIAATETIIPHPQNQAIPYSLPLGGMQGNEQVAIDLVVSGVITTNSTTNVTIKVLSGTSMTPGSDSPLFTSGAIAQNSGSAPFEIHLHMIYDSVSGKMGGYGEAIVNNTLVAKAALATVLTGLKDSNSTVVNFVLSGTSSAPDATHPTVISVKNFSVG